MRSLSISGTHPILEGPFTVSSTLSVRGEMRTDYLDIYTRYDINAVRTDDDADEPSSEDHKDEPAWRVRLVLVANFAKLSTDAPRFSDDELKSFAYVFGPLFMHPYAREIVQQNVAKLGYPSYTLSILEPLATPDDEEIEIEET
ncbi:hypothetical protein LUW76_13760 [Actinomadura madurae]|uniref:hypothetical protein n=1 Tax=Actinomadura madurae TaxID=1993 RepID=UPI0020275CA9|nr:hypothetical protein [Actinomadura madurae]URM95295.1 hypothetical protein LUW76_13760 [Actinomadura madurae]